MKLFLISQTENDDYDTYDSAVVCAADEDAARQLDPASDTGGAMDWGRRYSPWCSAADKVTVRYIGEAAPDVPAGVVCASFNAG